jgi:hypothetical protein
MHKELLVVTEPMQEIKHGKAPHFVGVKRRGKHNAIGHRAGKNHARKGVALDAPGGREGRRGEAQEVKEAKEKRIAYGSTNGNAIHNEVHPPD